MKNLVKYVAAATSILLATSAFAATPRSSIVDGAAIVQAQAGAKLTTTWRVAQKGSGIVTLEAVDAKGGALASFLLQTTRDAGGKPTRVTLSKVGSRSVMVLDGSGKLVQASTFAAADLALLKAASEDLGDLRDDDKTVVMLARGFWGHLVDTIDVALSCGAAVLEGGANPAADTLCVVAAGELGDDD